MRGGLARARISGKSFSTWWRAVCSPKPPPIAVKISRMAMIFSRPSAAPFCRPKKFQRPRKRPNRRRFKLLEKSGFAIMTNLISPAYTESDSSIPAIPPGVRLVTLQNGLTLIIREDHSAPVVSAQAWCKAGSIDEGKWLGAGLSHVLEHMLFKGTASRGAGRIDQEVQDVGGYMNAYT